jgi:hypothetical protein
MIRIDEIYDNVFSPVVLSKPFQSMHYFNPFGRTDANALQVTPLITKRNKAFLLWDQEPFFPDVHTSTIDWFYKTFINKSESDVNVTFVTSEKNSKNVNDLIANYELKSNYYFFHGWVALEWFRGYDRTFLTSPYNDRIITNTFMCPNRIVSGKREHRVNLFKELVKNNLVGDNKISFPARCPYSKDEIIIDNVKLPLCFDNEEVGNIPNESYRISLWEQSKNSLLYVVTETLFEEETLHLTEKIFKPIVMQMPFVLVGAQYNLEYLRSYGFKTFGDFWDEDYDNQCNQDRMTSIVKLLKELNDLSIQEKAQLQKHITSIVEYNFKWFYSKEYENLLWGELTEMMKEW